MTNDYDKGDRVEITIPAYILETYEDGDALVDADGVEMLVAEHEIRGKY